MMIVKIITKIKIRISGANNKRDILYPRNTTSCADAKGIMSDKMRSKDEVNDILLNNMMLPFF